MIRPIYLLGNPELRRNTDQVTEDSTSIQEIIDDLLETMYFARGIGLAAPQIGCSKRIFVVDVSAMEEEFGQSGFVMPAQPMVFMNPQILHSSDTRGEFEEGCLSIPDIHEDVNRPEVINIKYLDRKFASKEEEYSGMLARVIQHEYDHLEGVLFIDHITALRRRLMRRRLKEITEGSAETDYPVYAHGKGVLAQ